MSDSEGLDVEWLKPTKLKLCKHGRHKGFVFTDFVAAQLDGCEEFEIRESDVWVSTFPKSGTTWMIEITYLLTNDCDFDKAMSAPVDERSPYLEFPRPGKNAINEYPSPRVLKTHLPFGLLPRGVREGKCKLIYVMRNPKDVVVSVHHFMKALPIFDYDGTVEDCADIFLDGTCMYGPYWTHLQQYWELRHQPNVFITTYEQMQRDLPGTIRAVAAFLEKRVTDEQVMQVAKWCSFSEMKKNPMTNHEWLKENSLQMRTDFMRKGIVGDWKNHLTEEVVKQIDAMEERELKPLGITFGGEPAAETCDL